MTATKSAKSSAKPAKPAKAMKAITLEESEEEPAEPAEPQEPAEPAEPAEDWSVEEAMVKKLRATFQKQSEGEAELGVGKAMKVFLKSEVKPKDVGAMWASGAAET